MMRSQYQIAFWNAENLFDTEDSPRRGQKVARALGRSITGWTQTLLDRKIRQIASFICLMNGGRGPDILGLCEVENIFVADLLIQALAPLGRNYAIVHHDTQDDRGIDVAFLYDKGLFEVEATFNHFVLRRNATRDILQVNFLTKRGRRLVIMGNHWQSRSGGKFESAPYRAMSGETLAYFHERILEVLGAETPVLAMGDFNDEPFDTSIVNYALGISSQSRVLNGRNAYFLNLMWQLMGTGQGTYFFEDAPNLFDQILVNKNLISPQSPIKVIMNSVKILRPASSLMPIRFGGMGNPINENGFSDHFAIEVAIKEVR